MLLRKLFETLVTVMASYLLVIVVVKIILWFLLLDEPMRHQIAVVIFFHLFTIGGAIVINVVIGVERLLVSSHVVII